MSASSSKSLKLTFKGDKKKKKKTNKPKDTPQGLEKYESVIPKVEDSSLTGWRRVEQVDELSGPLFFLVNSEPPRTVPVYESALDSIKTEPELDAVDFDSCEPTRVEQVLVSIKVPGSSSINLKTCHNTFLAADKFGKVTASQIASGPLEEWLPVVRDDGVGFQSNYGLFLSYDPINHQLRADSDILGFNQVFIVKCQAKFKAAAKRKRMEKASDKLYHVDILDENNPEAKRAIKKGHFNEYSLDQRAKAKSDRYCK